MKVMFFAHDPGGANAIAPLIRSFTDPMVYGKGPALSLLPQAKELPENALSILQPDFLVTGTSGSDFTERFLWKEAYVLGIPSMAILDQWINYGVRFSRYGMRELHLFDGVCEYLPDYICVMDEFAKQEMMKDGVTEKRIITLGNPHFETIAKAAKKMKVLGVRDKKHRIVLFASEPFEDVYKKGAEEIALQDLIKIISSYNDVIIRIRKHPKEQVSKFKEYLSERVIIDDCLFSLDSIRQSDIVVSVSSMLLIEALFCDKMIVSYQPKCKDGMNDFILTRNRTLPFLSNIEELNECLSEILKGQADKPRNYILSEGITENITKFIKESMHGKIGY
jgi:hypothetical protein